MDILAITKDSSSKNIMLPRQVVSALLAGQQSGTDVKLPERATQPSDEDLENIFIASLTKRIESLENIENAEEVVGAITNALKWSKSDESDNLFLQVKEKATGEKKVIRGASKMAKAPLKNWVRTNFETTAPEMVNFVIDAIYDANGDVIKSQTATAQKDARNQEIQRMRDAGEFLNPEESAREYKKLGPRQKALALQNSYGVLQTGHFALNNSQSLMPDAPVNAQHLGSIKVGTRYVAEALNQVRDILNEEVYEIFESLKILSDSLNSFFANGLKDDTLAKTSIDNAENIQTKEILQPDE